MPTPLTFERILDALAENRTNQIEYYDRGECHRRAFSDVYRDTLAVAGYLRSIGVGRGDRVGIWFENDYAWITLDLACIATGAVSVPFHTDIRPFDVTGAITKFQLAALFAPGLFTSLGRGGFASRPAVFVRHGSDALGRSRPGVMGSLIHFYDLIHLGHDRLP